MIAHDAPATTRIRFEDLTRLQSDLRDGLRNGLDSPHPGALLVMASMLLGITAHPDVAAERTAEIVRGLCSQDRIEATAGALAMATLAGDDDLRRWVRRDSAERGHHLPRWLVDLHRCTPAERSVELSGPFRDVDQLVIGVTVSGAHPISAVVRVDNELGGRSVGGALFERPLDTVVEQLRSPDDPDQRIRDISTADARARLTTALSGFDVDALLGRTTDWHLQRSLVRWMLTRLPAGGDATVPGSMEDVDLDAVAAAFLTSPWGRPWARRSLPLLVESVLGDGLANGVGDPLLWAPHHVRRLLDIRRTPFELREHLDAHRTPELLRDLIRYGHAERRLRPELTDRSLAAVDRYAEAFLDGVREDESDVG
jgi:hypothetical protein